MQARCYLYILCMYFTTLVGMYNKEEIREIEQHLTSLVGKKILKDTCHQHNNIFYITIEKTDNQLLKKYAPDTALLLYNHNQEGICHFTPLIRDFFATQEPVYLSIIYNQYLLFDAAQEGNKEEFINALNMGAHADLIDERYFPITFVFQKDTKELCTYQDIIQKKFNTLAIAPVPLFVQKPQGWRAVDYAWYNEQYTILEEIQERYKKQYVKTPFSDHSIFDFKGMLPSKIDAYNDEKVRLHDLQKTPTFACIIKSSATYTVKQKKPFVLYNFENQSLAALITIDKDSIIYHHQETPLSFGSLATICAAIACFNDTTGKEVIKTIQSLSGLPYFKRAFFHALCKCLIITQWRQEKPIIENLHLLTKLKTAQAHQHTFNNFLVTALQYLHYAEPKKHTYTKIITDLYEKEHRTTPLCTADETFLLYKACLQAPRALQIGIKTKIQTHILREYLARLLAADGTTNHDKKYIHLPLEITTIIANYWHPTRRFIDALQYEPWWKKVSKKIGHGYTLLHNALTQ